MDLPFCAPVGVSSSGCCPCCGPAQRAPAAANLAHPHLLAGSTHAEGPTTLHLHDRLSSVAGLAVSGGRLLQASIREHAGTRPDAVSACTDVQDMLARCPGVRHLLCLPFGAKDGASGADGRSPSSGPDTTRRHLHNTAGSGTGALLLGFSAAPDLNTR